MMYFGHIVQRNTIQQNYHTIYINFNKLDFDNPSAMMHALNWTSMQYMYMLVRPWIEEGAHTNCTRNMCEAAT